MFIAHLPAGFLVGTVIARRWPGAMTPLAWWALLLGSIAPDIDLLYFYLLSDGSINHHVYPPHVPIVWLICTCVGSLCLLKAPSVLRTAWLLFCAGWCLHLVLDTVAGGIWWLWPWVTTPYVLLVVPRRFDDHWLNLLSRPAIVLELVIVVCAWLRWRTSTYTGLARRTIYAAQRPKRPYRTFL